MAWITTNDVTRELGRLTSENHREDDAVQAIAEATATAEGYLRAVVSDTELASWDTANAAPTDIVLIVARLAASSVLSRFYGQSLRRRSGDSPSRAADLNEIALKELKLYSTGAKRLVSKTSDDQIAVESTVYRTSKNTTRKFDVGTDASPKKLDRF